MIEASIANLEFFFRSEEFETCSLIWYFVFGWKCMGLINNYPPNVGIAWKIIFITLTFGIAKMMLYLVTQVPYLLRFIFL